MLRGNEAYYLISYWIITIFLIMCRSLNCVLYGTIRLIPAADLYSVTCDGSRYFIATDTFWFSFSQRNHRAIRPSLAQPKLWLRNAHSGSGDPFVQQKTGPDLREVHLFLRSFFLFISPDVVFCCWWERGNLFFKLVVHKQPVRLPAGGTRMLLCNLSQICSSKQAGGKRRPPPLNKRSSKTFGQTNFMGGNSTQNPDLFLFVFSKTEHPRSRTSPLTALSASSPLLAGCSYWALHARREAALHLHHCRTTRDRNTKKCLLVWKMLSNFYILS